MAAVQDIDSLPSVEKARRAGLTVHVRVPRYEQRTWRGYLPGNEQIYMGWLTPEEHEAIQTAVDVYQSAVTPNLPSDLVEEGGSLRRNPRVARWIFSTDGVGLLAPSTAKIPHSSKKKWVDTGEFQHPPMFGIGSGIEQNTHKIGECVDTRELQHVSAFLARFPSRFYERAQ